MIHNVKMLVNCLTMSYYCLVNSTAFCLEIKRQICGMSLAHAIHACMWLILSVLGEFC